MKAYDLAPLVGADGFFKAVSATVAYMLPIGHPLSLRDGSGSRSTKPGSFQELHVEFMTNDRAVSWNDYDGNPANALTFSADEPILLDTVKSCAMIGPMRICRSSADNEPAIYLRASTGDPAKVLGADGQPTAEDKALNSCLIPADATGDFPEFDLFASNLSAKRSDPADPYSWDTVLLASAADIAASGEVEVYGLQRYLQMTDSCEDWVIWMRPAADIPADSSLSIWGQLLTAGK